jgi:hypothetical protein
MHDNDKHTIEADAFEDTVSELVYRLQIAREGSAEYRMIERQLICIRHGSELGGLIIEGFELRAES